MFGDLQCPGIDFTDVQKEKTVTKTEVLVIQNALVQFAFPFFLFFQSYCDFYLIFTTLVKSCSVSDC